MQTLLQAAGVGVDILNMVPSIIDTCDICRSWQRVGPRSVASTRLPQAFNQEVQIDLLFFKTKVILHCIDACTRWSSVQLLPNREYSSIIDGFAACWLRLFGPPALVLSDQEGALVSDLISDWMDRRGIKLDFRAREQHCGLVERHNAILRHQLHLLDGQASAEGLAVPFTTVLAESVFAKNAMFQVGNASPYECVFGRSPPLLAIVGEESGEGVSDRDATRIRRMAIHSMIQATADQKARIANDTKTRRSGELLELREGDLVEFYRKPITKDASGWHGPAEVVNLSSLQDGVIYVKWQGRVIAVRIQDIRTALIFAAFLMKPTGPIRIFKSEAKSQTGHVLRVGWLRQGSHWTECQANRTHSTMLEVGLYVAAACMHLQGVIGFRFGAYLHNLPTVSFDDTLLLWWKVGSPNLTEWCHCFLPGNQLLNVPKVCGHSDVCAVQFFMVDVSEVMSLRQAVPDIPHLGGQYEPDMPHSRDCTDEVFKTRSPKQIKNDNPPDNPPVSTPLGPQAADASQPENAQAFAVMDLAVTSMPSVPSENDLHYVFDFRDVMSNIAYLGMSYDPMPMCSGAVLCGDDSLVIDACELDEPPVFSFAASMTQFVTRNAKHLRARMSCDNLLSFVYQTSQETDPVIERVNNILTRSEALSHVDECRESMILELMRWERHGAWKRGRMDEASNVLKSK